ncbi:hypothetical protein [Haloarcula argentinensis]|uniref:hypothetical protein n=1 Tax=Haloarcula argentinensis TaxID=43776 RepID=UPI0002AFDE61|nr:hypothetical protein [Haloarcula argentinensis]EMA19017.1 electron transfer flavoprotein subunit alpha [Haloarcula argentinensis DSM 12282]
MPTVRYTADGGIYRVGGRQFEPGDAKTVDDELDAYLADHEDFEAVDDAGDEAVGQEDGPPDAGAPIPDPSEHSVKELRDKLNDIDDIDVLAAVYEAEEAGDTRDTAIEAIQSRINAVKED